MNLRRGPSIPPKLFLTIVRYPILIQLALPRTRWIIIGLYLLLLFAIGMQQGVLVDKEALKYTGCARDVLHGDLGDLTGNYLKYAGYVLFLLPFVALDSLWLAVAAQVVLGIIAAEALARYAERLTGNVGMGRIAMVLFLLCPLIQTWALALYTEHFFTCMAILFVERMDRSPRLDAVAIGLGLLALFARPVGLFFVVPALLWKWSGGRAPRQRNLILLGGGVALLIAALFLPRVEHAQLAPIASGQVIAGIGGAEATHFGGNTIADAQRHLLGEVGLAGWCGITLQRVASLFTLTRPWYSAAHNATNALFLLLYPLALLGLVRWWRSERIRLLLIMLALNTSIVGLTHDEWSGRFAVPLLPWIMVLACAGLHATRSNRPPS